LLAQLPAAHPSVNLTLLLAVVKFDAFEWAIEKATELGVSTIVPLVAERSEKALLAATAKRAERWKKILLEASQQSRRVSVPVLEGPSKLEVAFASHREGLRVMLSERETAVPLRKVLQGQRATSAVLAIGPEGGWTDEEFATSGKSGFTEASLGNRILRTETAVVTALASLNFALGDD